MMIKIDARLFAELAAAIAAATGQQPPAGFVVIPITAGEAAAVEALERLPAEFFKPAYTSATILPDEPDEPKWDPGHFLFQGMQKHGRR